MAPFFFFPKHVEESPKERRIVGVCSVHTLEEEKFQYGISPLKRQSYVWVWLSVVRRGKEIA